MVTPERLGLCGAYNWLDAKASIEINPAGPNQPIQKGTAIDAVKGELERVNEFISEKSGQAVPRVTVYSIMDNPMTSCGCFSASSMLVPEANGVMVVNREDTSMTPCGMKFSTLAGTVGGGLQTPGFMGVGKYYLTSEKFISAEGGFKRVVWMSLLSQGVDGRGAQGSCARRSGDPDLLDKIADERVATTADELAALPGGEGPPGPDNGSNLLATESRVMSDE